MKKQCVICKRKTDCILEHEDGLIINLCKKCYKVLYKYENKGE